MPKFIIERKIPGSGNLTHKDLQQIAQKSCCILQQMGPKIQWIESYITDNKVYCIYIAEDKKAIQTHAEQGGFPANFIAEIKTIIDPTTGE